MKNQKLDKLFESARKETAPAPSEDFAADVLRVIRREPPIAAPETMSLFDQLNLLFPKIVFAAAIVILLCLVADYGLTAAGLPGVIDGAAQLSAQQLFSSDGLSL